MALYPPTDVSPSSTIAYTEKCSASNETSFLSVSVLTSSTFSPTYSPFLFLSTCTTTGLSASATALLLRVTLIGAVGWISFPSALRKVMSTALTVLASPSRVSLIAARTSSSSALTTFIVVPSGNAFFGASTLTSTPPAFPLNGTVSSLEVLDFFPSDVEDFSLASCFLSSSVDLALSASSFSVTFSLSSADSAFALSSVPDFWSTTGLSDDFSSSDFVCSSSETVVFGVPSELLLV